MPGVKNYAQTHIIIKQVIREMLEDTHSKAVVVTEIVPELKLRRVKLDSRTLHNHLHVMAIDGIIEFPYNNNKKLLKITKKWE